MGKRLMKVGAIMAAGGMMLGSGGCLDLDSWWGKAATAMAWSAAYDFVADNDAVFDLFQDDFGTGTQYDDRFVVDATRAEPDDDAQNLVDAIVGR
jgi:hypothetical protein